MFKTLAAISITAALLSAGCSANSNSAVLFDTDNNELTSNIDNQALLQKDDLVLVGSFRVPQQYGDGDAARTLAYAGTGLAYNPTNHSLFITGHEHQQRTAEISIPSSSTLSKNSLPSSKFLREPFDATAGTLENLLRQPDGYARIGGYLVADDRLIISGHHFYDTEQNQIYSHFQSSKLTQQPYSISPPFRLSSRISPRWSGGAMAHIPPNWQAEFGGQYLSGIAGLNIVSNASAGPTATVFSNNTPNGANDGQLAVGYPLDHPLAPIDTQNHLWNLTSRATGIAFPANFQSVLFIGRHGLGPYCYGSGEDCNDPESPWQGTHAYPYRYQIWAYKAEDLSKVAKGRDVSFVPRPYSTWELDLPVTSSQTEIGGAAWDEAGQRLYISQLQADGTYPLIHVFRINR